MNTMIDATMRLFKGVLANNKTVSDALFAKVNKECTKHGLIAPKEVCSEELYEHFKNKKTIDRNTTFYKDWNDVISKDRFELFIDQIIHYLSTYGTDFTGEAYVPNKDHNKIAFDSYVVIKTLSKKDLISGCEKIISTNVALDKDTINDILNIFNNLSHKVDYSIVKNKEILMHLHDIVGTVPDSPVEMVRFLLFKAIGKTLLIKDESTIAEIKIGKNVSKIIEKCGLERLAEVFFRFKPIFLAFKSNSQSIPLINKIRKLADKHHKPMEEGYFETIISKERNLADVSKRLETLSNFKKITLLNAILDRLHNNSKCSPYIIRNGKLYVKEVKEGNKTPCNENYLKGLYNAIYDSLIGSMSKKACKVILPKSVSIAMPTSSKKFIGEIPFGSVIKMNGTDNIIGIHWTGKDGARDIDLSNLDISGDKIGWNADYYNKNNSVVYSGDMTYADPEASELLYASGKFKSAVINVNLYSGDNNSKFEFFIAQEKIKKLDRGYMVDPNNIVFKTDCSFEGNNEKIMGIVTKKEFVFQSLSIKAGRVANFNEWKRGYINHVVNSIGNVVMLKDVLEHAGFEVVTEAKGKVLDLSNFSKEQILNLVS